MKKFVALFIFSLAIFYATAQTGEFKTDSLRKVIITTENDSVRAYAHYELSKQLIIGGKDMNLVKAHLDSASIIFNELKDKNGLAAANYAYGVMYRFMGEFQKSLEFVDKSLPYYESVKDTLRTANISYEKGVILLVKGDYEKSLIQFYKAQLVYESLDHPMGVGATLNSIGNVYTKLQRFEQAIESFKKAIDIHEKSNQLLHLANANSNIANVYMEQKKFDAALEYYLKAREFNLETNNDWGQSINNQKISEIFSLDGKYDQALTYLNEALAIQEKNYYKTELAETLAALGFVHLKLGNFSKSEASLKKGLDNLTDAKEPISSLHQNLFALYKETNRYQKAIDHYEKYTLYKDSLINETSLKNINELQVKYETERKNKEITEQRLQLEQQQNDLQKKKTQYSIMTGIAIVLLISTLLGWFLYQQRQKRKNQEILTLKREQQVKTLESLMEGEEKERFRIARELHDGVNGDLSAIKYKLTAMLENNTNVINEVVGMIDRSSQQVRAISHNLVPPALEKFSLIEALEDYCATMNEVHQPQIIFQHIGETIPFSKTSEVNIYRIIQEMVSNSIKHAGATEITVQISHQENTVQITVEDNGKGFNPEEIQSSGIGLKNIQSRINYLGATMDLISNPKGTSYTIEIDLEKLNDN